MCVPPRFLKEQFTDWTTFFFDLPTGDKYIWYEGSASQDGLCVGFHTKKESCHWCWRFQLLSLPLCLSKLTSYSPAVVHMCMLGTLCYHSTPRLFTYCTRYGASRTECTRTVFYTAEAIFFTSNFIFIQFINYICSRRNMQVNYKLWKNRLNKWSKLGPSHLLVRWAVFISRALYSLALSICLSIALDHLNRALSSYSVCLRGVSVHRSVSCSPSQIRCGRVDQMSLCVGALLVIK